MSEIVLTKDSNYKQMKVIPGSAYEVINKLLSDHSEDRLIGTMLDGVESVTGMSASSITKENLRRDFVQVEFLCEVGGVNFQYSNDQPGTFEKVKKSIKTHLLGLYPDESAYFFLWQYRRPASTSKLDRIEHIYKLIVPLSEPVDAKTYSFLRSYVHKHFVVEALQTSNVNVNNLYRDHRYSYTKAIDLSSKQVAKFEYVPSSANNSNVFYVSPFIKQVQAKEEKKKAKEQRKAEREAKKKNQVKGLQYDDNGDLVGNSISNWVYMLSHLSDKPLFGRNLLDDQDYIINDFTETFHFGDVDDTVKLHKDDLVDDNAKYILRMAVESKYGVVLRNDKIILKAVSQVALMHKFNPFLDFVQAQTWDGKHRIANVFCDFLGAPKSKINHWLSTSLFITTLNLVINHGNSQIVFDFVGDQGTGKTTLLQKLFLSLSEDQADENWGIRDHGWYTDDISSFSGKDDKMEMEGKLVVNDDEMAIREDTSVSKSKKFASKGKTSLRVPYAEKLSHFNRTYILTATTNKSYSVYLSQQGNRKFAPVMVRLKHRTKNVFSADLTPEVVGQMWAEAYDLFNKLGKRVTTYTVPTKKQEKDLEEARQLLQYIDAATIIIETVVINAYDKYYSGTTRTEAFSISQKDLVEKIEGFSGNKGNKVSAIMQDNLDFVEIPMVVEGKPSAGFAEKDGTAEKIESARDVLKARLRAQRQFTDVADDDE